ncbi:hypothetical protein CDAR_537041 [Caerostris darwini]|uniref:Uncharacterized protein n=1 Tax=Caerostris darwini TaxID=1538125 RepID=A0AAV4PNC6_9ARAC|nr:hypothetical protein CDAR_537041 [Caerostris darwini]
MTVLGRPPSVISISRCLPPPKTGQHGDKSSDHYEASCRQWNNQSVLKKLFCKSTYFQPQTSAIKDSGNDVLAASKKQSRNLSRLALSGSGKSKQIAFPVIDSCISIIRPLSPGNTRVFSSAITWLIQDFDPLRCVLVF